VGKFGTLVGIFSLVRRLLSEGRAIPGSPLTTDRPMCCCCCCCCCCCTCICVNLLSHDCAASIANVIPLKPGRRYFSRALSPLPCLQLTTVSYTARLLTSFSLYFPLINHHGSVKPWVDRLTTCLRLFARGRRFSARLVTRDAWVTSRLWVIRQI